MFTGAETSFTGIYNVGHVNEIVEGERIMDIQKVEQNFVKERYTAEQEYERNIERLRHFKEVIERLPEVLVCFINFPDDDLLIDLYPFTPEEGDAVAKQVREILHKPTYRTVQASGTVYWECKATLPGVGNVNVCIANGTLAPGCHLEPHQVTRTEFTVVCEP